MCQPCSIREPRRKKEVGGSMSEGKYVRVLWQVMDELQHHNQWEDILTNVLTILKNTYHGNTATCFLKDEESKRAYVIAHIGEDDFTGYSVAIGEGVIGKVISDGNHVIQNQELESAQGLTDDEKKVLQGKYLIVPMRSPFGVVGCIVLGQSEESFNEEEVKNIENIASLIAVDVEDQGYAYRYHENKKVVVSLRGVIKEFLSGEEIRRILKGIDLDIYEKELLVVLGESGCGKSTMLNIIGGMDQLTEGELWVEGKDFSHPSEQELTDYRRDYIGYIFQSYNLMPNLTALENIEFIAEIAKDPLDSKTALEQVGLGDRWNRYPSSMSGGQQQRVCIARAIVKNPKIVLADEPTAALDLNTGKEVLKVIENIVKEHGTTIIMVTHNVEIAKMANRVIRLKDGKISSVRVNRNPLHAEELNW